MTTGGMPAATWKNEWLRPRWESAFTAYKDCDSSLGMWNDPPRLRPAGRLAQAIPVGRGRMHLLADASIAALRPRFDEWRGRRVAVPGQAVAGRHGAGSCARQTR
jgi:hypothetical protein